MAYTTVDKVKSMFRKISVKADTGDEKTNTVLTIEEVDEFILETDAMIDCRLEKYYTVPITGVESLKIVGMISKFFVAETVKGILKVDVRSDKTQDVQGNLGKKAEKLLNDLLPMFNKTAKRWEAALCILSDANSLSSPPDSGSVFSTQVPVNTNDRRRIIIKGGSNGLGGDNW